MLRPSDSTSITRAEGPHTARIEIIDAEAGLDKQKWQEQTNMGLNYGKECFRPTNNDYVCRVKYLT